MFGKQILRTLYSDEEDQQFISEKISDGNRFNKKELLTLYNYQHIRSGERKWKRTEKMNTR